MARNPRSAPLKTAPIEYRDLSSLAPYAKNARTHSDEQVASIAASMREWGWTMPVLVAEGCEGAQDGEIIAGHGRVLAAATIYEVGEGLRMAGGDEIPRGKVPVMRAKGWTQEQRRGYVIADNQLTLAGGWDDAVLRTELVDLRDAGFDLTMLGFDDTGLAAILDTRGVVNADPDDIPDAPAVPVSRTGDVWLMGRHRLLCGDATSPVDVARITGKVNLCLTDPPYGLGASLSRKNKYAVYDDTPENLDRLIAGFIPLALGTSDVTVFTPGTSNVALYPAPTWTMAWFTPAGTSCGPWGFCCWQPILCYGNDPKLRIGKGCHPDAIVHTETAERLGHPCNKPIKFWSWVLDRCSEPKDLVFDPFAGSGTTIIAAEIGCRNCNAIEIDPSYVDVCVLRWHGVTGEEARLEKTGQTYAEVALERAK